MTMDITRRRFLSALSALPVVGALLAVARPAPKPLPVLQNVRITVDGVRIDPAFLKKYDKHHHSVPSRGLQTPPGISSHAKVPLPPGAPFPEFSTHSILRG